MVLELGFRVKFVCIQNFKLILNILEHLKPSISSLKQPGRQAGFLPIEKIGPYGPELIWHLG